MGKRCLGHCCVDIGLPVSPEELKDSYLKWKNSGSLSMALDKKSISVFQDIWLIYPMLKFIKQDFTHPEMPWKKQDKKVYHYECRFFDRAKKKCSIYSERPEMCRSYPDKEYCANPACAWTEVCKTRPKEIKDEIKKYNTREKEFS